MCTADLLATRLAPGVVLLVIHTKEKEKEKGIEAAADHTHHLTADAAGLTRSAQGVDHILRITGVEGLITALAHLTAGAIDHTLLTTTPGTIHLRSATTAGVIDPTLLTTTGSIHLMTATTEEAGTDHLEITLPMVATTVEADMCLGAAHAVFRPLGVGPQDIRGGATPEACHHLQGECRDGRCLAVRPQNRAGA